MLSLTKFLIERRGSFKALKPQVMTTKLAETLGDFYGQRLKIVNGVAKYQIFCIKCQEPEEDGKGFSILFNRFHLERIVSLDHVCCLNRMQDSIDVEAEEK